MADEFIKGMGILTAGGLAWMTLAGWYNTPAFDSPRQLIEPTPENLDIYGQLAVALRDVFLVFAIVGALAFWVGVPALRQLRQYRDERGQ